MGDYGHDLEFGVFIDPAARAADQVVALSALAEEAGYDLVTFNDHFYSPRSLDVWTLMSFVAARTGRVRQVRDEAMPAGDARAALNEMALRQNDWTLGAFCARYCSE
ncbi:MAG TPA: LLM class flavin-dependent oxidoreductase, partial [Kribbella sp.]